MGRKPYTDDPVFRNKGPWRGGKFIALEGGVRVPLFVTWPAGGIQAGTTDCMVALYDLMATFCDIGGVASIPVTDGISFAPLLAGDLGEQELHEFLYWESGGHAPHARSARFGKWFAWQHHPSEPLELYDTEIDVASEFDAADEHPDIVQEALALFKREHVDSEWFLNPGETEERFQAKAARANAEGCLQIDVCPNTEYRGDDGATPQPGEVHTDPGIPD
jgi:arylsulfatase A-like enzyme